MRGRRGRGRGIESLLGLSLGGGRVDGKLYWEHANGVVIWTLWAGCIQRYSV